MAAVGRWVPMFTGTALRWDRLDLLREHWDGPIVLKGVQHVDDALQAVDAGMDGIVVSNHGGRQVDRAIGALDALPGIVGAVDGRAAVLFDSGIRTGADAAVALALGADLAVAVTGIAGPGGGTPEKPVGTVYWSARTAAGAVLARDMRVPGDRGEIRDRSTTVGMHLLRRLLRGEDLPI